MNKKIIIALIIMVLIILLGVFLVTHTETVEEYIPESEIENSDLRKTAVTLYFQDKESKTLCTETRLIDSKELLKNPYITLIKMLIEGPNMDNNETLIPYNTKILNTELNGNCLSIDLSKDFIENANESVEGKINSLYQIVNTLTELNEVTSVKFYIEGEESNVFNEYGINLTDEFVRRN